MSSSATCAKDTITKEVRSVYRSIASKRRHQKAIEMERKLKWNHQNENGTSDDIQNHPKPISRQTDNPNIPLTNKCLKATLNVEGEPQRITSASRTQIPAAEQLPKHIPHVPMNRYNSYSILEDPIFIPYLGDDKTLDLASIFSEQEMELRNKATEEGSMMERDETNAILDQVLLECSIIQGIQVWKQAETTDHVLSTLAQCACLSRGRIQERYQDTIVPLFSLQNERTNHTNDSPVNPLEATICGECINEEGVDKSDADYLEEMDSYRALFCRKCFTYSCSLHGVESKPSLQFQHAVLLQTNVSNQFPSLMESDTPNAENCFNNVKKLSSFQKKMCKRAFFMCDGDYRRISAILGAPEHLIQGFVREHNFQLPSKSDANFLKPRATPKVDKYSVKRYNQKWYNAIKNAEIHPLFTPCCHEEPCSEETCSCIQNRFFCTPACCWGELGPNFFRGCGCKGSCNASSCTCFAAKRECDPELCSCCPCSDPPDRPASKQQCRNDNLRMRRHAHLLLAPSVISGWGCFTKHPLRKGDFIHEYVGELISQEVAEKRGQIDDAKNRSYLFNLSSDYTLDGCRTGNKTRFINHSDKPNVETRTVFVNGDQCIGMFALEHVDAEEELFFDYRYNVSMSNDLIEMAKYKPAWLPNDEHVKPPSKSTLGKRKRGKR